MARSSYHTLASVLVIAALLAACDDDISDPRSDADPSFTILDGARGGNAQFYFLPPMVPAPTYSGTFDATQTPVVNICELAGSSCGPLVTSFSGADIKIDPEAEAYIARWKTKGAGLSPTKTYRVEVLLGTNVLGYADVVVASNGSQIKVVDQNQYVAIINGGVLQVRFRIEAAATPPPPCTPGTPGCGWASGDLLTYDQESWGGDPTQSTAAALLVAQFNARYATGVVVGYTSGFLMALTSAAAILNYLPQSGAAAPLNSDLLDPSSSPSGVFGGFVLALQLDVDFSDSGHISGTSGLRFGDLRLCGLTTTPAYSGMAVREFLGVMNTALGAGAAAYSFGDMAILTGEVSGAFEGGTPSSFAQAHLVNGACPAVWQNGDLVTYSQDSWGGDPATSAAAALLLNRYSSRYPAGIEVGLLLGAGFSMFFTSATAIFDFLPASGTYGALNADLIDPTSSASGYFGGYVLALQLNVDFTDSGDIVGTSGIKFGDLRLCGLPATPAYNGMTVRQFLAEMNTALGGGPIAYNYDTIAPLTNELSLAFEAGVPASFAQNHLVNGACS